MLNVNGTMHNVGSPHTIWNESAMNWQTIKVTPAYFEVHKAISDVCLLYDPSKHIVLMIGVRFHRVDKSVQRSSPYVIDMVGFCKSDKSRISYFVELLFEDRLIGVKICEFDTLCSKSMDWLVSWHWIQCATMKRENACKISANDTRCESRII